MKDKPTSKWTPGIVKTIPGSSSQHCCRDTKLHMVRVRFIQLNPYGSSELETQKRHTRLSRINTSMRSNTGSAHRTPTWNPDFSLAFELNLDRFRVPPQLARTGNFRAPSRSLSSIRHVQLSVKVIVEDRLEMTFWAL